MCRSQKENYEIHLNLTLRYVTRMYGYTEYGACVYAIEQFSDIIEGMQSRDDIDRVLANSEIDIIHIRRRSE